MKQCNQTEIEFNGKEQALSVLTSRSVPTPRPRLMSTSDPQSSLSVHHQSEFCSNSSTFKNDDHNAAVGNNKSFGRSLSRGGGGIAAEDQSTCYPSSPPDTPTSPHYPSSLSSHRVESQQRRTKILSRPHSGSVSGVDVLSSTIGHPDFLISGGYDGYLALLDPTMLSVCYSFRIAPNESAIVTLKLCEYDHTHVIAACLDSNLYIADVGRQKTIATLKGHSGKLTGCGFIQASRLTASRLAYSVGLDRTLRLWDIKNKGSCLSVISCSNGISCSTVNGSKIAIGHSNGCITLWGLMENIGSTATTVPTNNTTASSQCILHRIGTFQPLAPSMRSTNPEAIHEGQVAGICFSSDGTKIYSVGRDGRIAELSILSGQMVKSFHFLSSFRPPSAGHNCICVTTDDTLVTASTTGLCCWEIRTGRCITSWATPAPPTCIAWTGELLSSGHADGTVILWSVQ